jgi:hypothetical protein
MITLDAMVPAGSVSEKGAGVLRDIGARGASFLVYSLPSHAGKSTLVEAVLAEAPPGLARHEFLGTPDEVEALTAQPAAGYVVVAEIGHRGRPGYLVRDEVVRAFSLLDHGYSLASSLHADTVDQVYDVLEQNHIGPAAAMAVRYLIKVQPLGDPFEPATARVVETVHEVTGLCGDRPSTTAVYEHEAMSR